MVDPVCSERLGLRRLLYVATLADEVSVRRAAALHDLPPRILAREIAATEREAGTRLFKRLPHGLVPTTAGRELAEIGRAALGLAVRENQVATDDARALRIGSLEYGRSQKIRQAALAEFRSRFPHVLIDVVTTHFTRQIQYLSDVALDVGFCAGPAVLPVGLASEVLEMETVGSALLPSSHALSARYALSMDEMRGDPVVRLEESLPARNVYDEMSRRGWNGRFTSGTPSHATLLRRIAGGAGWSPMVSGAEGWLPARLVLIPMLEEPLTRFEQRVAWRVEDPVAHAFVEILLEMRDVFDRAGTPGVREGAEQARRRGSTTPGRAGGAAERDPLLQAVVGSELILEGVRRRLPPEMKEETRQLALVIDGLQEAARAERQSLEALHASGAPAGPSELGCTLDQAAKRLRVGAACTFSRNVFGAPLPLDPTTEDTAYRIAVEAMAHAFGDPATSGVAISISYHPARFRVAVFAVGSGGAGTLPPGVEPMRRWAGDAGGRLAVRHGARRGICVSVRVPGAAAYAR
jgi:DNA-binding transcriptional LysR family regulator